MPEEVSIRRDKSLDSVFERAKKAATCHSDGFGVPSRVVRVASLLQYMFIPKMTRHWDHNASPPFNPSLG